MKRWIPGNALAGSKLDEVAEEVATLSDDVRNLAYLYHPSNLRDLGLVSTITSLVENIRTLNHLPITVSVQDVPRELPAEVATCVYRIAQESVQNIVKHAQATSVQLELGKEEEGLSLIIQDDGVGFSLSKPASKGLGLLSMKVRVRALKGRLAINSVIRKGTKIDVWIPFHKESF